MVVPRTARRTSARERRRKPSGTRNGLQAGTTLCEVVLALVLMSGTAAWVLQAAAAAERAAGHAHASRRALHRAGRALAELNALPCDSINIARTIFEPRWRIDLTRDHDGPAYSDDVLLVTPPGDSIRLHRGGWCT